ncbi:MAG: hypothetical protein V1647_02115, partial [Pseudomonadota bacterium]
ILKGKIVSGYIAESEYVLISKALKAPQKNRVLILEYIAKGPSELFFQLAVKYKLNLKDFVK